VTIDEQIAEAFEHTHPNVTPAGTRVDQEHALPSVAVFQMKPLDQTLQSEDEKQSEYLERPLSTEVLKKQASKKHATLQQSQPPDWIPSHPCMALVHDVRSLIWQMVH
jgi:hypothetical protein